MGEIDEFFAGNDAIDTLERRLRAYRVRSTDAKRHRCEHGRPQRPTQIERYMVCPPANATICPDRVNSTRVSLAAHGSRQTKGYQGPPT
jgi:hypothetical protein